MRPADEVKVVFVKEFADDLCAKGEADSSVVFSPAHGVLVGVRPQQVAQQPLVGHVCRPHDATDLLHALEVGAEAAVAAEDLFVDYGSHRQAVEAVGERLPQLDVVAALALIVEAVYPVDGGALVVAAQQKEVLRVLDLVGQKQADGLQRLLPSVDVVAQEQVIGLRWETAVLEKTQQVIVLAVYVTCNQHKFTAQD